MYNEYINKKEKQKKIKEQYEILQFKHTQNIEFIGILYIFSIGNCL